MNKVKPFWLTYFGPRNTQKDTEIGMVVNEGKGL